MKQIKTTDAVGHLLCHDITEIVRGVTKGAAFRKGHVVREQDIQVLLRLGKEHLFVWEVEPGMVHEDDGALALYRLCAGAGMEPTPVREGKIDIIAKEDGLLLVDTLRLRAVNALGEMMIATRHSGFPVRRGDKLAGTRVIPLAIAGEKLAAAKQAAGQQPLLRLLPMKKLRAGIIATGGEVYHGRIQDTFTPVLEEKLAEYGCPVGWKAVLPDDNARITETALTMIREGAELILCTGGMSVDPDDRTPLAIRNTGARVVSYGAPVLPGAMFLLAYHQERVPILGLPGCVMYARRTIFDLVLPRILAGEPVTAEDLAALGHGGLCLSCDQCTYPNCGFGKGI